MRSYAVGCSGRFAGEYFTTTQVTPAASVITQVMKTSIASSPRTVSTADLE
jgi:hypothetical protein